MLIDTHCHLNFKTFDDNIDDVVKRANESGVGYIIVPGTDYTTSKKALDIALRFDSVYAAAAIHPHHIFEMFKREEVMGNEDKLVDIESLLKEPKVVAVGEVGLDRHMYSKTKYQDYKVEEEFVNLQKEFLKAQIDLAIKYKKSLILHNREAKEDFLALLSSYSDKNLEYKTVFHCCEPDMELLQFAKDHKFFIGVDGDVAYSKEKQEFIKSVPLEMLVLETDSPFLSPTRKFPNAPSNIPKIAQIVAELMNKSFKDVEISTTENAKRLFSL